MRGLFCPVKVVVFQPVTSTSPENRGNICEETSHEKHPVFGTVLPGSCLCNRPAGMRGERPAGSRKAGPGGHMSLGTALGVGIQCLEALEGTVERNPTVITISDLHSIGYLHRDVKPGNYTVGRQELNELRKV